MDTTSEDFLRRRISKAEDLLATVEVLDPGYTSRKGRIVKLLANDRLHLAKMLKDEEKKLVTTAMEEIKTASECLKYAQ